MLKEKGSEAKFEKVGGYVMSTRCDHGLDSNDMREREEMGRNMPLANERNGLALRLFVLWMDGFCFAIVFLRERFF